MQKSQMLIRNRKKDRQLYINGNKKVSIYEMFFQEKVRYTKYRKTVSKVMLFFILKKSSWSMEFIVLYEDTKEKDMKRKKWMNTFKKALAVTMLAGILLTSFGRNEDAGIMPYGEKCNEVTKL